MGGAIKLDDGKLMLDLIPPEAIEGLAEVLTYGAKKYEHRNWEKGFNWMRVYASLQRHLLEFSKGNDIDEESGLSHLHHALANISFLVTFQDRKTGTDNRPTTTKGD